MCSLILIRRARSLRNSSKQTLLSCRINVIYSGNRYVLPHTTIMFRGHFCLCDQNALSGSSISAHFRSFLWLPSLFSLQNHFVFCWFSCAIENDFHFTAVNHCAQFTLKPKKLMYEEYEATCQVTVHFHCGVRTLWSG